MSETSEQLPKTTGTKKSATEEKKTEVVTKLKDYREKKMKETLQAPQTSSTRKKPWKAVVAGGLAVLAGGFGIASRSGGNESAPSVERPTTAISSESQESMGGFTPGVYFNSEALANEENSEQTVVDIKGYVVSKSQEGDDYFIEVAVPTSGKDISGQGQVQPLEDGVRISNVTVKLKLHGELNAVSFSMYGGGRYGGVGEGVRSTSPQDFYNWIEPGRKITAVVPLELDETGKKNFLSNIKPENSDKEQIYQSVLADNIKGIETLSQGGNSAEFSPTFVV